MENRVSGKVRPMQRWLLAFWLCFAPPATWAACNGTDLAPTLTPTEERRLQTALDAMPYPRGNHWRATRGGMTLHLIGTIHIDDPRLAEPIARLQPLITGADRLLLEMTSADGDALSQTMASDPALLLLPGPSLPDRLPEADWQALSQALEDRGLPPFMAARMRPWYLSVLLSMPACLDLAEAAAGGVDKRLEAMAEAAGIPTSALEDARGLFAAFDAVPFESQMDMVRTALLAPDAAEDMLETLMIAYTAEEHGRVWLLSEILAERFAPQASATTETAFALMQETLLDARNRAWIAVLLDAAANADGYVVAAFGAAHLGGEAGVLTLLEAEGFTLERQPF
jgi:uncharacterized protein YbaP (TraB family)